MTDLLQRLRAPFAVNVSLPPDTFASTAVASLTGGGFAVFVTNATGGKVQRYNAAGDPVGTAISVPDAYEGASITGLANGGFVVGWNDASSASFFDVKAQIFSSGGVALGASFLVNATLLDWQMDVAFTGLTGGGFLATWYDGSPGDPDDPDDYGDVKGQLFSAAGAKIGGEFVVSTVTYGPQTEPSTTALVGGGFVVTWSDYSLSGGGSDGVTVKAQVFDGSGAKVGGELLVNTSDDVTPRSPSIAALAGGGFVVSWGNGGVDSTRAQIFAADGSKVGDEITTHPSADRPVPNVYTAVAGLPDGGFVLIWKQYGDLYVDLHAQQFDAAGHKVGAEFVAAAGVSDHNDGQFNAAMTASGDVVLNWIETRYSIYGQQIDTARVALLHPGAAVATDITLTLADHATLDGAAAGTVIGSLAAVDANINDLASFAIVSDPTGGGYAIVGSELVIADASKFAYAMTPGVGLTIRVTGADGLSFDKLITAAEIAALPGYTVSKLGAEITAGPGAFSDVAARADGGFALTWSDLNGALGDPDSHIDAQFFGADGGVNSVPFRVNSTTQFQQVDPQIASFADGRFVIAWTDNSGLGGDSSFTSIKAQLYAADGTPVGAELLVNTVTQERQLENAVAAIAADRFVVTWSDYSSGSGRQIKGQLFNLAGDKIGGEFQVNLPSSSGEPTVTGLAGGNFVVSWTVNDDIAARVFGPTGLPLTSEFTANTETYGRQVQSTVTALANGNFVVTWSDEDPVSGQPIGYKVRAQVFAADGTRVGSAFLVTNDRTDVALPSAAATSNGGFVVTWTDSSGAGDDFDGRGIRAQFFTADGQRIGNAVTANTQVSGDQLRPEIATLANGDVVATWEDRASGQVIKAQPLRLGLAIESDGGGASASLVIEENNRAVTTVHADRPTVSAPIIYTISGGADAALFDVDAASGAVTFKTAPDYAAPTDVGGDNVYNVTVRATASLGYGEQSLAITVVPASAEAAPELVPQFTLTGVATGIPGAVYGTAGDFNGDGRLDLVIVDGFGIPEARLLTNEGAGVFTTGAPIDTFDSARAVYARDLNSDGKLDLVYAQSNSGTVGVALGNGDGSFAAVVPLSADIQAYAGSGPHFIASGDFNGDSHIDLVTSGAAKSVILLGAGDGSFAAPLAIAGLDADTQGLAIGDFDGDGLLDLAISDNAGASLKILGGNGDGSFDVLASYGFGSRVPIGAGDFDGDGRLDLALGQSDNSVLILIGKGDGSFAVRAPVATGAGIIDLQLGDIDGDGALDIITSDYQAATVSVLLGRGDGSFQGHLAYSVPQGPSAALVGDYDGDGDADLAVTSADVSTVSLLRQNLAGSAVEGGPQISGQLIATHPVAGTPLSFALDAPVAGLVLNADGSWTFDPADTAYQSLAAGESQHILAAYRITDAQGHSKTSTLPITIAGIDPPVTGVVQDGYIAGATVYRDANNNGAFDAGEAATTSDANGAFSLPAGPGSIRAFGGTNIDTGKPNQLELAAPAGATVINPLTTLVQTLIDQGSPSDAAAAKVKAAFGVAASIDLSAFDPLAAPADPAALTVQKATASIAAVLDAVGAAAPGAADAAQAAAVASLAALATAAAGAPVDLSDSAQLNNVVTSALPDAPAATLAAVVSQTQAKTDAIASATSVTEITTVQANNAPVIGSYGGADAVALAIAENAAAVAIVAASDSDAGASLGFSLSGDDAALFQIEASTGVLSFKAAPDFESRTDANADGVYTVLVSVSDGTLIDTQAFAVSVADVAEARSYTGTTGNDSFMVANLASIDNWTIDAGKGNDTVTSGAGDDRFLAGAGNDNYQGGGGNDLFLFAAGGVAKNGSDSIDGGAGFDTLRFEGSGTAINLAQLTGVEQLSGIRQIIGTASANLIDLTGAATDVYFSGGILGGGGNDTIRGSMNGDTISGDGGNDSLAGNEGDDSFAVGLNAGIDRFDGGAGFDRVAVTTNNVKIGMSALAGVELVTALHYSGVSIVGSTAADVLDFTATSLVGITLIDGGTGNDTLIGSADADTIRGGAGQDWLAGGGGADVFDYNATSESGLTSFDTITDFATGLDRIDLDGIDANTKIAGNQAFAFIGNSAFTKVAGQLRIDSSIAGLTQVLGDTNGDGKADLVIKLTGELALTGGDFLL